MNTKALTNRLNATAGLALLMLGLLIPATLSYAHNKVVVIPMAGDNVEVGIHLDRTQVVGGSGTALQNGVALIQAINFVKSQSPSAASPWLIRLEPGTFNLGSQRIILTGFIHITGAGPTITEITSNTAPASSVNAIDIRGDTEVSDIRISNTISSYDAVRVFSNAKVRFHNVHIHKQNPTGLNGVGLGIDGGGQVELIGSKVTAIGSTVEGVFVQSGSVNIIDSHVETTDGVAVFTCCLAAFEFASITIQGSKIITNAISNRSGILMNSNNSSLFVSESFVKGSNTSGISSLGSIEVRNSTIFNTVNGSIAEVCVGISTKTQFFSSTCP